MSQQSLQLELPFDSADQPLYTYRGCVRETKNVPIRVYPPAYPINIKELALRVTAWPTSREERLTYSCVQEPVY